MSVGFRRSSAASSDAHCVRKRGSPDVLGRPRVIAANAVAGAIIGTVLYLGELGGEERHATQRAAS